MIIGKQKKLILFKVTEPSSIPYRLGTHSACANMAAYPDPPPVIPVPDTGVAQVPSHTLPRSGLSPGRVSWRTKTEMTESRRPGSETGSAESTGVPKVFPDSCRKD
jgi:hypothetical protein